MKYTAEKFIRDWICFAGRARRDKLIIWASISRTLRILFIASPKEELLSTRGIFPKGAFTTVYAPLLVTFLIKARLQNRTEKIEGAYETAVVHIVSAKLVLNSDISRRSR